MIGINPDCPPGVVLLADHLDAALAAGEDLAALSLTARADLDESDPQGAPQALEAFVQRLIQLEASLVLRLLQARRLSVEIARADADMRSVASLFRAQTDVLHDLIADPSRSADGALARAGDSHAYIRSRGLIPPEAAAPSPFEALSVDESFRVGGVVELRQILDFVSSTLDLLDVRFGLYLPDLPDEAAVTLDRGDVGETGEAGRAPLDSLANVLGIVRATAVAEAISSAADADLCGISPESDRPITLDAPGVSIAKEATETPHAQDAGEEPNSIDEQQDNSTQASRSSRPVDYRSLASLIAEVQRSNDRM